MRQERGHGASGEWPSEAALALDIFEEDALDIEEKMLKHS